MCPCSNPFSRLQKDTHDGSTQLWEQGPKKDSLPLQMIPAVLPKSRESSSAPSTQEQVTEPSTPSTARISPSVISLHPLPAADGQERDTKSILQGANGKESLAHHVKGTPSPSSPNPLEIKALITLCLSIIW